MQSIYTKFKRCWGTRIKCPRFIIFIARWTSAEGGGELLGRPCRVASAAVHPIMLPSGRRLDHELREITSWKIGKFSKSTRNKFATFKSKLWIYQVYPMKFRWVTINPSVFNIYLLLKATSLESLESQIHSDFFKTLLVQFMESLPGNRRRHHECTVHGAFHKSWRYPKFAGSLIMGKSLPKIRMMTWG